MPISSATAAKGASSRVGSGQNGVDASARGSQRASSRRARASSSPGSGARMSCAARRRAGADLLGETLAVELDQAHGTLDDGPRTAVVRHEVDARAGRAARPPDPARGARPPGARRRSSGRRRRRGRCRAARPASSRASSSWLRSTSWTSSTSSVRAAALPPCRAGQRPAQESPARAGRDRRNRARRCVASHSSYATNAEATPAQRAAPDRRAEHPPAARAASITRSSFSREKPSSSRRSCAPGRPAVEASNDVRTVDQVADAHAGVGQDLAAECVERPHARRPRSTPSGSSAAASRSPSSSAARLLNVTAVTWSGSRHRRPASRCVPPASWSCPSQPERRRAPVRAAPSPPRAGRAPSVPVALLPPDAGPPQHDVDRCAYRLAYQSPNIRQNCTASMSCDTANRYHPERPSPRPGPQTSAGGAKRRESLVTRDPRPPRAAVSERCCCLALVAVLVLVAVAKPPAGGPAEPERQDDIDPDPCPQRLPRPARSRRSRSRLRVPCGNRIDIT